MRKFFLDLITETDNKTFDGVRIMAFITVINAMVLSALSIYKGNPFSMMDYGTGIGALFGGLGLALGMKKDSNV